MRTLLFLSTLLFATQITAQTTSPAGPGAPAGTTTTTAPATKPVANTAPQPKATGATATTTNGTVTPRPRPAAKPAESTAPAGYTGAIWKKQVTRDIELGEKIDTSLHKLRPAGPDNTLLEMFAVGIKSGRISSFNSTEFSMQTRIRPGDFDKLFVGRNDTIAYRNASGQYIAKVVRKPFNFCEIHKYRIMEEWTSYPGIGKSEIQITGIAPLKDVFAEDGTVRGTEPVFWVHYTDDIKAILARYDQYHPNNTLGGHVWEDYFKSTPSQK